MQIVFLFYDGMTALDAIGPHKVLCHLPGVKVYRTAENPGIVQTCSELVLTAEHPLSSVSHADIGDTMSRQRHLLA